MVNVARGTHVDYVRIYIMIIRIRARVLRCVAMAIF